jgi:arsenate reductase-like glutaredoxin family protein
VPLGREQRAHAYRQSDMSNAMIARKLGITETGVDKLFRRTGAQPKRIGRQKDTRQLDMFKSDEA